MTNEVAFNAAKAALSLYGGFFKDVVQEIGLEKAVSLHAKQGEAFVALLVQMTRARLGDKTLDLNTLASVYSEAMAVFGMTPQIEEAPNSVTLGWRQCPIYEGLRMAGLEHDTIEAMCKGWADVEQAQLNKAFPQLTVAAKFRPAPDQPCVQEFALSPKPGA